MTSLAAGVAVPGAPLTVAGIGRLPFRRQHWVFFLLLKTTGLEAAPWPQAAAHRSAHQARAESHEVPAAPEGEVLPGLGWCANETGQGESSL